METTDFEVVVLPWGATEAHNFHLPYATDRDRVRPHRRRGGEAGLGAGTPRSSCCPRYPSASNTGQIDVKLDINMNPSTQLAVLADVCDVLDHQGIPKLVILNGHGANDFRQMVRELWPRYEMFLCTLDWYRWIDADLFEEPGDHGGEMETSLIQHLAPDLMRPCPRPETATSGSSRSRLCAAAWPGPSATGSRPPPTPGWGIPPRRRRRRGGAASRG